MIEQGRLTLDDLYKALKEWDDTFRKDVLLIACGGTALTLQHYQESTKDVDFIIPIPEAYDYVLKTIKKFGYINVTGYGYKHPDHPWIFDCLEAMQYSIQSYWILCTLKEIIDSWSSGNISLLDA